MKWPLHFLPVLLAVIASMELSELKSFNDSNALNGQHLRVIGLQFSTTFFLKKNATGHLIYTDGVLKHMLDSLSEMLKFSYHFVPHPYADRILLFDDGLLTENRGAVSYLLSNEVDYVLAAILGNSFRFQKVDYTSSWTTAAFGGIIPFPRPKVDVKAPVKPLSNQVWILIAVTILSIAFYLYFGYRDRTNSISIIFSYVLGNILSQGQRCISNRLTIRIAAGAWCLGCFFLVQIYCCTLTSHLLAPNQRAIVNSFEEIADTPGVRLTVDKGYAIDSILTLQNNNHTGFMKRLSDMLHNEPSLRCVEAIDCLKKVKEDQHLVYLNTLATLKAMIGTEVKKSKTCDYTLMKETFWPSSHLYTVLRKNSPYTESMNRGILRLRDAGLINAWESWYLPSSNKCADFNKRKRDGENKSRLSLGNLSGAFVILLIGYAFSLTLFVIEKIAPSFVNRNRRTVEII